MGKFKYMPEEMCPNDSEHIEYNKVYRATKSIDALEIEDFLPWNIEYKNAKKTFKNAIKRSNYGMSIFTDLQALKNTVSIYPALNESTKSFSEGFTTLNRGISVKEDEKHHVEYYLYDYKCNSPKDDFHIIEVK